MCFLPKQNGFTVLLCGGKFDELNGFVKVFFHNFFDFFKRYIKKLPPLVNEVQLPVRKCVVQGGFQFRLGAVPPVPGQDFRPAQAEG